MSIISKRISFCFCPVTNNVELILSDKMILHVDRERECSKALFLFCDFIVVDVYYAELASIVYPRYNFVTYKELTSPFV